MSGFIFSGNSILYRFLKVLLIIFFFCLHVSAAAADISLVLTSNLEGRFSVDRENQDSEDPMLLLAQSIIHEKKTSPFDAYIDLGNAFYPGFLSRYSYGSVMMDFLGSLNCESSLVSSRDLSIGLSNLEFLSKGKQMKLLSSNIARDNQPVFTPYYIKTIRKKRIGFIGLSSSEGIFDIADKKVLNIMFKDDLISVKETVSMLKNENCDHIVLLSGLSYKNNLELMNQTPEIDLTISGGDSKGDLFSVASRRVDLESGRSIVSLQRNDGFYRLDFDIVERLDVKSVKFIKASRYDASGRNYTDFSNRLSIWKDKFNSEGDRVIANDIQIGEFSDVTVAHLLRDRYRCEIGIMEMNSIVPGSFSGEMRYRSLMKRVTNDYPVFIYRLTGLDLNKVVSEKGNLVITGIDNGLVQGYPVSEKQLYSICSTQLAYDRIVRILKKEISYTNTWSTLQDEIENDIKKGRVLTGKSFDYLDDRFRLIIDFKLSNFYDRSIVTRGDEIETPPGKPEKTYRRWGMEDTVNFTLYNKNHQLVLTPYIYFIKQDLEYQQNLLRGTLLYVYDPNSFIRPYHKSMFETVVVEVDSRPMQARETVGISLKNEIITGKIGTGFEKQIQYPEKTRIYGFETLIDVNIPITEQLTYSGLLDSFISLKHGRSDELKARVEFTNALSFKFNTLFGFSIKYKMFDLYSKDISESYRYSQTLVSIDMNTDFKFF